MNSATKTNSNGAMNNVIMNNDGVMAWQTSNEKPMATSKFLTSDGENYFKTITTTSQWCQQNLLKTMITCYSGHVYGDDQNKVFGR
jgi:ferric iron reductase protein FhuF